MKQGSKLYLGNLVVEELKITKNILFNSVGSFPYSSSFKEGNWKEEIKPILKSKPSDLVIGIDPSLNKTGICILDMTKKLAFTGFIFPYPTKPKTGAFCADPDKTFKRVMFNKHCLQEVMNHIEIGNAAIEGYALRGVGRVSQLAENGGQYKAVLWEQGVKLIVIPPKKLKKLASGNGNASKELMTQTAEMLYGVKYTTTKKKLTDESDEADALLAAKCCEMVLRGCFEGTVSTIF